MATVTFDTLKFVETLESVGVERKQASAIASAVRDSHETADLITRKDLDLALAPVHTRLALLQWMVTATLAGVGIILTKLFLG